MTFHNSRTRSSPEKWPKREARSQQKKMLLSHMQLLAPAMGAFVLTSGQGQRCVWGGEGVVSGSPRGPSPLGDGTSKTTSVAQGSLAEPGEKQGHEPTQSDELLFPVGPRRDVPSVT